MFKTDTAFQLLFSSDLLLTQKAFELIGATTKEAEYRKYVCGIGDYELHYCLDTEEKIPEYKQLAHQTPRGYGIIFYIGVRDLDEIFTKAQNAPGKLLNTIADQPWGCREFLWQDPNGYTFAFYQEIE